MKRQGNILSSLPRLPEGGRSSPTDGRPQTRTGEEEKRKTGNRSCVGEYRESVHGTPTKPFEVRKIISFFTGRVGRKLGKNPESLTPRSMKHTHDLLREEVSSSPPPESMVPTLTYNHEVRLRIKTERLLLVIATKRVLKEFFHSYNRILLLKKGLKYTLFTLQNTVC